jgi:hypothetical protein
VATETHVAGADLEIQGRYLIQRCAWCGCVLLSYDYERTATPGEWRKPGTFTVGGLVRFSYDGPVARWGEATLSRTTAVVLDDETLPDDACALNLPFEEVVPRG